VTYQMLERRQLQISELQQALQALKAVLAILELRVATKRQFDVVSPDDNRFAGRILSGISKARTP